MYDEDILTTNFYDNTKYIVTNIWFFFIYLQVSTPLQIRTSKEKLNPENIVCY